MAQYRSISAYPMSLKGGILKQLLLVTAGRPDWLFLHRAVQNHNAVHLAIMTEPFLTYILSGRKTVESRFSKNAVSPFDRVEAGDIVLLKASGGPVVAYFTAGEVEYSRLDKPELARLEKRYGEAMCVDDSFWNERQDKRYATLIAVQGVHRLSFIHVSKTDRRGWVVLT